MYFFLWRLVRVCEGDGLNIDLPGEGFLLL